MSKLVSLAYYVYQLEKELILKSIKFYQKTLSFDHGFFSFMYPNGYCRYKPTCSQYAYEAVERKGIFKGLYLAVKRVLRCHPFAKGGYDPVP